MIWLALILIPPPEIQPVETPEDVAQWVVTDLLTVPAQDQPFQRYVWVPSWSSQEWHHAITFAINASASRSGTIQKPVLVANGWLQRWDLRQLVQKQEQLDRLTIVWDSLLELEPYFHVKGTGVPISTISYRLQPLGDLADAVGLPVYRGDWFLVHLLSAIDGGAYQRFRGFAGVNAEGGRTPEERVLSQFGVFEAQAIQVDGDRRVGMFESGVTGQSRSVMFLSGLGGYAWITEDVFEGDSGADRSAIHNLLENNFRGREIIFELPNGLHGFLITDDKGGILSEAPPELVSDYTIPDGEPKRLDGGAISCIRCHASEQGLRTCRNDVAKLLAGPLRVLDDLTVDGNVNAIDEIATRYSGRKFDRGIRIGRENYEIAVDELTGGQMNVEELSNLVGEIFSQYKYGSVTPEIALRDIGFVVSGEDSPSPVVFFREVVALNQDVGGFRTESPEIAALYVGDIPIQRFDFERIYPFLLERSIQWRKNR